MRKFNQKSNVPGNIIETKRNEKGLTREDLAKELQLLGLNVDRHYVYRVEKQSVLLKDFELFAFSKILDIDLNRLKSIFDENKNT